MRFTFDNTFARQMGGFYVRQQAAAAPDPRLVLYNAGLSRRLGLEAFPAEPEGAARILAGVEVPPGADPLAQVYAGHQFGGFSPRLGDGRALLLGEVIAPDGARFDIQLKGAGPTPYSRGGDGFLALGPALREFLVSEAMHGLGIPTTRALAVVTTGAPVYRERILNGAVLTRVAASHLRIGTFEYFAARGEIERVRQLADYAIARHYPDIGGEDRYTSFYRAVIDAQARLVAQWMASGFVHGVMNTDNTTISGETIDYGPCAFIDTFDPARVFSSIDDHGRYAFGNQPRIMQWNLARLGETLIGLIDADEQRAVDVLTEAVNRFVPVYQAIWLGLMGEKLGLVRSLDGDADLIDSFLSLLAATAADHTRSFRALSAVLRGADDPFLECCGGHDTAAHWLAAFKARHRLEVRAPGASAAAMDRVNPLYIARNHLVEEAIEAATGEGDLGAVTRHAEVLADPFTERPGLERYAVPAAGHDRQHLTFCGT